MDLFSDLLAKTSGTVSAYWEYLLAALVPVVGTAVSSYLRRPKSSSGRDPSYFAYPAFLTPPATRPGYSDRMAYVLAELSSLAYYPFEQNESTIDEAVEEAQLRDLGSPGSVRDFLDQFSLDLLTGTGLNLKFVSQALDRSGFRLLGTVNIGDTQALLCRRLAEDSATLYDVVAFRGTEAKVRDWLTDLRCVPRVSGEEKVHTGFLEAFSEERGAEQETVEEAIKSILVEHGNGPDDDGRRPFPLYLTGHSLGGALALLATKRLAPNVDGACYTFGAPRIANYEYFRFVKTPVFRIVNSSDIVPRVPPGAGMLILRGIVRAASWATGFLPPVSSLFSRIEKGMDKLNGYRHFGDLRYLSDVVGGRFKDVRLLRKPPAIDRIRWMWRHLAVSARLPFKSHSMYIYRKKLEYIARERNGKRAGS